MSEGKSVDEIIVTEMGKLREIAEKAQASLLEAKSEAEELQRTFDLIHRSQMRAIKRWQEATGRELVWPDNADLCVWLMEQLDEYGAANESLRNQLAERTK